MSHTCMHQDSIAEQAGLTAGSIILKVNGESVLSFRAWSLASVFRSVECGSLPEIAPDGDADTDGVPALSLTIISHPTDPPNTAKYVMYAQFFACIHIYIHIYIRMCLYVYVYI